MVKKAETYWVCLGLFVFAYIAVASIAFTIRHPWMTDTERLIHFGSSMTFSKVSYESCRPRNH